MLDSLLDELLSLDEEESLSSDESSSLASMFAFFRPPFSFERGRLLLFRLEIFSTCRSGDSECFRFLDDALLFETSFPVSTLRLGGDGDSEPLPPPSFPPASGDLFPVTRGEGDLVIDLDLDFCLSFVPEN